MHGVPLNGNGQRPSPARSPGGVAAGTGVPLRPARTKSRCEAAQRSHSNATGRFTPCHGTAPPGKGCPSIRHTGATIGGIGFSVGGLVRTGRRGGRGGDGIPANPKELKGGSANDGVPSLSLISIFGFLSVNPSSVAAMPAICLLPYIAIGDRGEARTVTTHCSRTMRSLRRHMGGKVIVVVSATAFFGRTCKHCCRGQHGYHD